MIGQFQYVGVHGIFQFYFYKTDYFYKNINCQQVQQ